MRSKKRWKEVAFVVRQGQVEDNVIMFIPPEMLPGASLSLNKQEVLTHILTQLPKTLLFILFLSHLEQVIILSQYGIQPFLISTVVQF